MTQETHTRYLIVTHNAVTMSRMDRLYGVTMIEKGVSRLVSVDLGAAENCSRRSSQAADCASPPSRARERGVRARHQMIMPVIDSSAGMIPPRKISGLPDATHAGPVVPATHGACERFRRRRRRRGRLCGSVVDGNDRRAALRVKADLPLGRPVGWSGVLDEPSPRIRRGRRRRGIDVEPGRGKRLGAGGALAIRRRRGPAFKLAEDVGETDPGPGERQHGEREQDPEAR